MSTSSSLPTRRGVLVSAAAAGGASLFFGRLAAAGDARSGEPPKQGESSMGMAKDNAIRPFTFNASDEALADLRRRIAATKWPERETVADTTQGVQLATMQELARYWGTDYDWRKVEARLKALPQFVTEIDGLDIHFIHVRSTNENALPMIVTHGWPGSIIEQLKIIDPLTDPTAHGGSASDAFDVVIPSLPGYGFSGKPTAPGLDPRPHRPGVGDADAAPRLHEVRRAGRRLGECRFGDDGPAAAAGIAWHPHQHGGHGSAQHLKGARVARGAARRSHGRRAQRVEPAGLLLQERAGLRHRDVQSAADALRARRFAGWPRSVDARP